jgi:hypothetical protein
MQDYIKTIYKKGYYYEDDPQSARFMKIYNNLGESF